MIGNLDGHMVLYTLKFCSCTSSCFYFLFFYFFHKHRVHCQCSNSIPILFIFIYGFSKLRLDLLSRSFNKVLLDHLPCSVNNCNVFDSSRVLDLCIKIAFHGIL